MSDRPCPTEGGPRVVGVALVLALTLGALALFGVLASPMRSPAAFPGQNGKIAFHASGSIYSIRPDGMHWKRLTPVPRGSAGWSWNPAYSANGKRIVFERLLGTGDNEQTELFKMRANGSHKVRLTHTRAGEFEPAFSPSGNRIVFVRFVRGSAGSPFEIFTMRANGSHERRLTDNGSRDVDPEFSPGGNRIVFVRDFDLAIMAANGAHQRLLARRSPGVYEESPDFSPNGKTIVFDSSTGKLSFNPEIYKIRTNGSHRRRLTQAAAAWDESPVFSPNGKRIAFTSDRHNCPAGCQRIYVMRKDGSHVKRVTERKRFGYAPSWGVRR